MYITAEKVQVSTLILGQESNFIAAAMCDLIMNGRMNRHHYYLTHSFSIVSFLDRNDPFQRIYSLETRYYHCYCSGIIGNNCNFNYSQGKMAADSLNKVDDSQTQNRKIHAQLGDSAFSYNF